MLIIFIFTLGLTIGSFLNAFLYRFETKQTIGGRSFCPKCKKQIAWYDNIPLFSWLNLKGKCRNCKKNISVQYPAVELLTGVVFGLVGFFSKEGKAVSLISNFEFRILNEILIFDLLKLILLLFIFSVLILISVYDVRHQEIPNGFNLVFILSAAAYLFISYSEYGIQNTAYHLAAAAFAFFFFWSLVFFSRETWMGGGDAKLVFGIGLLLGPTGTFVAIFLGSILGSVYGLSVLGFQKFIQNSNLPARSVGGETRNFHLIPFGPFLALGCFISFLFGSQIVDLYVKIFLGF